MTETLVLTAEEEAMRQRNILIGQQNDRFRATWGADFTIPGRIVMTRSLAELPLPAQLQIMQSVQQFDTFEEDNDPYLDRVFGAFEIESEGETVPLFWKIDLYDADYQFGSEAPENPQQTRRLLTIMRRSEY
jgi:hypothetical protein